MCNFAADLITGLRQIPDMKYAIIAAGQGSRLVSEGVREPKPLVKVQGEHLIDRLIRIFMLNDAEEIVVICNDESPLVEQHLRDLQKNGLNGQRVPLSKIVVKTTPSSMHSLYELSPWLAGSPFVVTTVDTIFGEDYFREFIQHFQTGMMGVTDYLDDEKPLYVVVLSPLSYESVPTGRAQGVETITAFLDERPEEGTHWHVSAGVYALMPEALDILRNCIERGESRMRNFQRALIASGMELKAMSLGKVFDIDHAEDIRKAEAFLGSPRYWLVPRGGEERSPLRRADRTLLEKVGSELDQRGYERGCMTTADTTDCGKTAVPHPDVLLCMSRDNKTLRKLQPLTERCKVVVNSPLSVLNNTRDRLQHLMLEHNLPVPPANGKDGYWVKAPGLEDLDCTVVEYHPTREEAEQRAAQLERDHFRQPVISAHVKGAVIKFYGVGTSFFRCYEGEEFKEVKGLKKLKEEAQRLANLMKLDVWGGDAVIDGEGNFFIIDMNDWPSFRPCQDEAANAIANLVDAKLGKEKENKRK